MKLGTPIGAGPKGAIVVVGLPRVGAPPASNWAPPSPSSPSGWSPPPVALGAWTAPPELPPPLASPRLSLSVAPPLHVAWPRRRRSSRPARLDPCRRSRSRLGLRSRAALRGRGRALPFVAGRGRFLAGAFRRDAVRVFEVDQAVGVVVEAVGAGGRRGGGGDERGQGGAFGGVRSVSGSAPGHRGAQRRCRQQAGERDDQCDLGSHPSAPRYPRSPSRNAAAATVPSPSARQGHGTRSPRGPQRPAPPPNMPLISNSVIPASAAFQPCRMALVKLT